MSTEDQEAAICRVAFSSSSTYSHAANILLRLAHLKDVLPHDEAIAVLHDEVMDDL